MSQMDIHYLRGIPQYSGAMRLRTTICLHRSWLMNRVFDLLSNSRIPNITSHRLRIKLALAHFLQDSRHEHVTRSAQSALKYDSLGSRVPGTDDMKARIKLAMLLFPIFVECRLDEYMANTLRNARICFATLSTNSSSKNDNIGTKIF